LLQTGHDYHEFGLAGVRLQGVLELVLLIGLVLGRLEFLGQFRVKIAIAMELGLVGRNALSFLLTGLDAERQHVNILL
jgi:hypothetical protein